MRQRITVGACASLLAISACASSADSSEAPSDGSSATPSSPTAEAPGWTGATIPEGTYRQVLTQKSLDRHGITVSAEEQEWAPDGTLTAVLRIDGERWAQLANYNGDAPSVGAQGTLSYDPQGRMVQVEPPFGESRYTWTLDGNALTIEPDLAWMRSNAADLDLDAQDTRIWKMMCCGTWTKVD